MSTTKKPDDDLMQQLQEPALETVRLQARRSMSPEEQRLLANNPINMLLGRGLLPKEPRLLDSDDTSNAVATASASLLDDPVAQILAGYPGAKEEDIREALAGAKQAPDGHWYIPDPARSREMVEVVPQSIDGPASAPKRQPSSCEADGGFVMNDNVIHLLPAEEEAILRCYVTGLRQPGSFRKLYDALEIPVVDTIPGIVSRLQIAVAQILLHHVQDSLPQWATMKGDELLLNRRRHKRHKDGLLPFAPRRLFSINWATSGPGYDWPEEYRITYLPGFDKYVFTASRDGDDMWGCADHAIGVAEKSDNIQEAARKILTGYWRTQAEKGNQQRWEDCLAEGLINRRTALAWANEVWADPEEEDDYAEEDDCA